VKAETVKRRNSTGTIASRWSRRKVDEKRSRNCRESENGMGGDGIGKGSILISGRMKTRRRFRNSLVGWGMEVVSEERKSGGGGYGGGNGGGGAFGNMEEV
jgi:hypothetical protein